MSTAWGATGVSYGHPQLAEAFVELQKARQQADYAHEGQYSKLRVLAMIDAAEDAIVQFEQAEARHRRSFAVHVLFKRRP